MFCFLLLGRREVVSCVGRNDLGHSIKQGWGGLKRGEAFAPSQESCDSLKLFAISSSSQHTAGDLVESNKRRYFSKDLTFIED